MCIGGDVLISSRICGVVAWEMGFGGIARFSMGDSWRFDGFWRCCRGGELTSGTAKKHHSTQREPGRESRNKNSTHRRQS